MAALRAGVVPRQDTSRSAKGSELGRPRLLAALPTQSKLRKSRKGQQAVKHDYKMKCRALKPLPKRTWRRGGGRLSCQVVICAEEPPNTQKCLLMALQIISLKVARRSAAEPQSC